MKTLDQVIGDVLEREGWPQVTDRASDRGGLTKGGVTFREYNLWRASIGKPQITEQQLRDLDESDARAFFVDQFSRPFSFIADEGIFVLLVDWAVTSGPDDPTAALQAAMKKFGHDVGSSLTPGPKTKAAWKEIEGDFALCQEIEDELLRARVRFYVRLVLRDPEVSALLKSSPTTQAHNLAGWINRCLEFM